MFKPLYELTKDINIIEQNFKCRDFSNGDLSILALEGENIALVYIRNTSDNWENTLRDMKNPHSVSSYFSFGRNIQKLEVHKIWDDDMVEVTVCGDVTEIKNIRFGIFVKVYFNK